MPRQTDNRATRRRIDLHADDDLDATPSRSLNDATALLHSAVASLELAMRSVAEAILLEQGLDESLGIEAQRLIGVLAAVKGEIKTLENRRLRGTD